jgi:hypothetical protein
MLAQTDDIQTALTGMANDSAKTRERIIHGLTINQVQDARIIDALQRIVSTDPVEYVRDAAREKLVAAGLTPAESVVPVQLKNEGAAKPAAFAVGCTLIPILIGVAVLAICAIAIFLLVTTTNVFR